MRIFVPVLLFWCFQFMSITFVLGDVGTAGIYSPPFLPSQCYGNYQGQFPSSNLFVASGDGVWDNGAACGRQYLVRCISAHTAETCIVGTIQVIVVDWFNNEFLPNLRSASVNASTGTPYTLTLSETAYRTIANVYDGQNNSINIEFQQV